MLFAEQPHEERMENRNAPPAPDEPAPPDGGTTDPPAPPLTRRTLLAGAVSVAGGAALGRWGQPLAQAPAPPAGSPAAATPVAPADASRVPGLPSAALGPRSPFEAPALVPTGVTVGA